MQIRKNPGQKQRVLVTRVDKINWKYLPNKNDAPKVKLTVYFKENFNIYKERLELNAFSKIYFTYRHCL